MIVLIDGPDRVGKDTLSRGLMSFFRSEIFLFLHTVHIQGYDKENYYKWYETIYNLRKDDRYSLIVNRTHLSEYVFGSMYREYDVSDIFSVEKVLLEHRDVFLVFLVDKIDNLLRREDGNSIHQTYEKKQQEVELFDIAFQKSLISNKIKINIQDKNEQEVLTRIINFINNSKS